ncbi:hypothetical protein F4805DRAFT_438662 [Annulohypoxylon moriforme]|nr:hypothetical protein F4805DRAFT_438662 [Annulohypoxylon moriforme]
MARPRRPKYSTPLLIQFLPEEGFTWFSKFDTPFVTNSQARHITKAMKGAGKKLDEAVTAEYMTDLYLVARQLVGRCAKLQPQEFWAEVGSHLVWARSLTGFEVLDFSNRILSARNKFNDRRQFYRESRYEIPEEYRVKVDDALHRCHTVIGATPLIYIKYETLELK